MSTRYKFGISRYASLGALALASITLPAAVLAPGTAAAQAPAYSPITPERQKLAGVWLAERPTLKILTTEGELPPLTEEAAEIYQERVALRAAGDTSFDKVTWCATPGMPRLMFARHPFEIVIDERRVAVLYSWYSWFRSIDMSGTDLEVIYPIKMGLGMGRWEGDTLVVKTVGLDDSTMLDGAGLPHSDNLTLTEHMRLLPGEESAGDVLEIRFTIDDPDNYTRPWETVMTYRRQPERSLGDYPCLDRVAYGEPALIEQ